MKTEAEFLQFYNEILKKKIDDMESLRKSSLRNYSIFIWVVLILFVSVMGYSYMNNKPGDIVVPIIFFGPMGLLIFLFTASSIKSKYRNTFKKEVVGAMIKFFDERLVYTPDKGIASQAIIISNLFFDIDEAGGSDYTEGQLGETFIQFSKIRTSKSGFTGIFMIASFNKYFNGHYIVLPRKYAGTDSFFNKTLHKIESEIPAPIVLENPDFEKEFAAFGSDEIEGRYILTPAFMEKMLDFQSKIDNDLYMSFVRSRLFIAFGTSVDDMFEPGLSGETTLGDVERWGEQLQLAIGIVEEFGLNTRIWSKR